MRRENVAEIGSRGRAQPRGAGSLALRAGLRLVGNYRGRALYGEFEPKPGRQGDSFAMQHLREVAIDHQNGIFAGTNDLIEKIGGRPPMTLEEFINKHRAAFTA